MRFGQILVDLGVMAQMARLKGPKFNTWLRQEKKFPWFLVGCFGAYEIHLIVFGSKIGDFDCKTK